MLLLVEVVVVLVLLELVDLLVDGSNLPVVVLVEHHVLLVAHVVKILDNLSESLVKVSLEFVLKLLLVHVEHVFQLLAKLVHHVAEG